MMSRKNWITVDLDGLAQTLARKGKGWILRELAQNALDEDVTHVSIQFTPIAGRPLCRLTVEDDSPSGFASLSDAWTMFAPSKKKGDPTKAGRFCAGEKLVLAFCDSAAITTTTGSVRFDATGRHVSATRNRLRGSEIDCLLRISRDEVADLRAAARQILPPGHVTLSVDGVTIPHREPVRVFGASIKTEVASADGIMRRDYRHTNIEIHEPLDGEPAMLYELGLPVVVTGDRWHVNVLQKVPLTLERDNVSSDWLADLRAEVLNHTTDLLVTVEAVTAPWVRDAAAHFAAADSSVQHVITVRFGAKAVSYDPSDAEANKIAVLHGYTVVHSGTMSANEWANVRRATALSPAGQVTPSPKPFTPGGRPLRLLDVYTDAHHALVAYATRIARALIGVDIVVTLADDRDWNCEGAYGTRVADGFAFGGQLFLNLATQEPDVFIQGRTEALDALLIHEFAHHAVTDHLSREFYDELCRLGAKLTALALAEPSLFCEPNQEARTP